MNLEHFHSHKSTGEDNNSFVGLKVIGNEIHFYYPESYRFDSASFEPGDIWELLNTISIAKSVSDDKVSAYDSTHLDNDSALLSCRWLIRDYITNGVPVYWNKNYIVNGSGRINWKRTLKQQPIISKGNLLFKELITEIVRPEDAIIVDAYKYCLYLSIRLLGWLFNIDAGTMEIDPNSEARRDEYLYAITSELEKTFNDDRRLRINHMRSILVGLDVICDEQHLVYGVNKYHYVFERMIDRMFGTEDVRGYYPKFEWSLKYPTELSGLSGPTLRPDTIMRGGNDIYIIDSKFYRYGSLDLSKTKGLPEAASIVKQIAYGSYVRDLLAIREPEQRHRVYNVFVLPYDSQGFNASAVACENKDLVCIGYVSSEGNEKTERVYTFLIDLRNVVRKWNANSHNSEMKLLIEQIINQLEKESPPN